MRLRVWVEQDRTAHNQLFLYIRAQSPILFQASLHSMVTTLGICTFHHLHCTCVYVHSSDRLVVSFQKTAVAVLALVVVFLKTAVAVVMRLC